MKGKRRTERQWVGVIGYLLAIEGGGSDGSYPGRESRRGRGFGERWTERSDMWKEILKVRDCTRAGFHPEKDATALDRDNTQG